MSEYDQVLHEDETTVILNAIVIGLFGRNFTHLDFSFTEPNAREFEAFWLNLQQ